MGTDAWSITEVPADVQERLVADLCDRNQPGDCEITSPQGEQSYARVRFLQLDSSRLLTDWPTQSGRVLDLREGSSVRVYCAWMGQRYALGSMLAGRVCWSQGRVEVPAMALRLPLIVERAQRRGRYRLSLMHVAAVPIELRGEQAPEERIEGSLINISETGGGALFKADRRSLLLAGRLYRVRFALPDESEAWEMDAELRWSAPKRSTDNLLVGLQWRLDAANPAERRLQARLGRYIAAEQFRIARFKASVAGKAGGK